MDNFGGSDKKDINYHHPFCHSNNVHLVPKGMAESSMKAGYEMNILQSETKNEVTFRKVDDNNDEDVELSENAIAAIEAVAYITNNMKAHKKEKSLREDWKYVSMTIDRLLLYFFIGVTLGSTYGIIATAPTFYERIDQQTELTRLIHLYRSGAKG
uniref:Neur_chan_memb domain-containing protein n=1 Tax=Rhabditophanes sp. KR3021 TaxID=114890 RepID=A0AC35TYI5_9BILA